MKKARTLEKIDTPHYGYWQALIYSFFSEKIYIDVGKRWKGFGIAYFLLMICVMSIPYTIVMIVKFENFFKQNIVIPFEKLPPIIIQNGEVKIDKPMPYFIKNFESKVMIILDTTGVQNNFSASYPDAYLLITKNKILYRNPDVPTLFNVTGFPDNTEEEVLQKDINQIFYGGPWINSFNIRALRVLFDLVVYPVISAVVFFLYATLFIAFAFIAQLMSRLILKVELTYKQSYRLLVVTSTPPFAVLSIAMCANFLFAGFGLLLIALLASYFFFAVLAIRRYSKKMVFS